MNIWAHRGCSQMYPENTITAFEQAAKIDGLIGIELDIQLTKDGHLVVFHDETIDRTTDGIGKLRQYTLSELKRFRIDVCNGSPEQIPTMKEVFDLLQGKLKHGLKLNIELKNSLFPYKGMEREIIDMVHNYGLQGSIIYSSFNALSLEQIKNLDPNAETGILDSKLSDCLYKLKGGCRADALHPFWKGIDLPKEKFEGYPVRAWLAGHLYPEKPTGNILDLVALEKQGITDVFLNEPEKYL